MKVKEMKRRRIAFLLALVMAITVFSPLSVLADAPYWTVNFGVASGNGELTATVGNNGITSPAAVTSGSLVTFTAVPADGFRVYDWEITYSPSTTSVALTGVDTDSVRTIESLGNDVTVVVNFVPDVPAYPTITSITARAFANVPADGGPGQIDAVFDIVGTDLPAIIPTTSFSALVTVGADWVTTGPAITVDRTSATNATLTVPLIFDQNEETGNRQGTVTINNTITPGTTGTLNVTQLGYEPTVPTITSITPATFANVPAAGGTYPATFTVAGNNLSALDATNFAASVSADTSWVTTAGALTLTDVNVAGTSATLTVQLVFEENLAEAHRDGTVTITNTINDEEGVLSVTQFGTLGRINRILTNVVAHGDPVTTHLTLTFSGNVTENFTYDHVLVLNQRHCHTIDAIAVSGTGNTREVEIYGDWIHNDLASVFVVDLEYYYITTEAALYVTLRRDITLGINRDLNEILEGDTLDLEAVLNMTLVGDMLIDWESTSPGAATVEVNPTDTLLATATGVSAGTTRIYARLREGSETLAEAFFDLQVIDPADVVAPTITGPTEMELTVGYAATHTAAFTITGVPTPTVSISVDPAAPQITWNATESRLDIAEGLVAEIYVVTLTATNLEGTDTHTFTLTVTDDPGVDVAPTITSADYHTVVYGIGGTFQVTADGTAPITFALIDEPAGVTINTTTGAITILDTVPVDEYTFTITATNALGDDEQEFTLTVIDLADAEEPEITSANNTSVVFGIGGTFQVTADGIPAPVITINGQPASVTINASGLIAIAGTVPVGGHDFTITATNDAGYDVQEFTLTVIDPADAEEPEITSANYTSVVFGTGGTFTVTATGTAPITFDLTDAPTGVTINETTGVITIPGTVPVGEYTFTITATNAVGSDVQEFTLTVTDPSVDVAPTITSNDNYTVVYGIAGTFQVTADGTEPITFDLTDAPTGVTINTTTGLITIADTVSMGDHEFTITATNDEGYDDQAFTLTVMDPDDTEEPEITSADYTSVVYGTGGTFQVTATGIPTPVFEISGQPVGVTINETTGVITIPGTVSVGEHTFTITATNVAGYDVQEFTLTVTDAPPTGVTITGNFGELFNNTLPITIELWRDGVGVARVGTLVDTIEIPAPVSLTGNSFTFYDVLPGTYSIVVSRPRHLSFTINNIDVGTTPVNLASRLQDGVVTLIQGDFTGGGVVGVLDFNAVLASWGVDGIGVLDFNAVLANWGVAAPVVD